MSAAAPALGGAGHDLADLGPARLHGGQLLESRAGDARDDPRKGRLPRARRPVEDRRAHAILLDRRPQRRTRREDLLLADELVERLRPHTQRERCDLGQPLLRCV